MTEKQKETKTETVVEIKPPPEKTGGAPRKIEEAAEAASFEAKIDEILSKVSGPSREMGRLERFAEWLEVKSGHTLTPIMKITFVGGAAYFIGRTAYRGGKAGWALLKGDPATAAVEAVAAVEVATEGFSDLAA